MEETDNNSWLMWTWKSFWHKLKIFISIAFKNVHRFVWQSSKANWSFRRVLAERRFACVLGEKEPDDTTGRASHSSKTIWVNQQTVHSKATTTVDGLQVALIFLSPAGMAEVLECKAGWQPAWQGAEGRWHCGALRCSGTQGGGKGSGLSADLVADQLWKTKEKLLRYIQTIMLL